MAGLINFVRRRLATRQFLKALPWRLLHDYGHRGPYTPEQVEITIRRHHVGNPSFAHYAQAIFCERALVEALWRDRAHDYDRIRSEVAGIYFGGDESFTYQDAARYSGEGETGGEGGHGGGHHGGDGGGHH